MANFKITYTNHKRPDRHALGREQEQQKAKNKTLAEVEKKIETLPDCEAEDSDTIKVEK